MQFLKAFSWQNEKSAVACNHSRYVRQNLHVHLYKSVTDSASNFGVGSTAVIFGTQVLFRVHYCKRDELFFTILL